MPSVNDNLRRIGDFANLGIYAYKTNDLKAAVETAGYFDPAVAAGFLEQGALLLVAGDLDGTPWHSSYTIASNDGTHATLTEAATVTQGEFQSVTVRVPALGTASNQYVCSPIAGELIGVYGVANGNGSTATAAVSVTVDTVDVADLSFTSGYTAGTGLTDSSVTANSLSAGEVIKVATDGGGDSTADALITLVIAPA